MRCAVSAGSWHAKAPAAVTVLARAAPSARLRCSTRRSVSGVHGGAVSQTRGDGCRTKKRGLPFGSLTRNRETVPLRSRPRLRRGVQAGFCRRASAGGRLRDRWSARARAGHAKRRGLP